MALAVQADRVVVIGRDRVEGLGTPQALYEQCPLFRYMCLAQYVAPSDNPAWGRGARNHGPPAEGLTREARGQV
jgi:hypothetical protein